MTNNRRPAFSFYTRNDLARSGVVAAAWVIFYILLAVYAGLSPGRAPKLAADTAGVSAANERGMAAALRPHHDRPAR